MLIVRLDSQNVGIPKLL